MMDRRAMPQSSDGSSAAGLPDAIVDACINNAKEAILVANMTLSDQPLCFVSDAFVQITGYSKQEAIGRNCRYLQGDDRNQPEVKIIRNALTAGQATEVTLRNYKKDGALFYNHLRLLPLRDEHGTLTHCIAFANDVTRQHWADQTIERLAHVDKTTGLLNREAFTERVRIACGAKLGGIVVVKLDVVRFHDINSGYGYDVGDHLLHAIAKRLTTTEAFAVGRMGANEFSLAFKSESSAEAEKIAVRTLQLAQQGYVLANDELSPRFSSGYAFDVDHGDGPELVRRAGTALHRSKHSQFRQIQVFSVSDDTEARRRIRLTTELKHAIANEEFLLHYQPKVDLATSRVVGAEALVRWQHPIFGLQTPGAFITHAEEAGLIGEIGEWCLKEAARFCKIVNTRSLTPVSIAVNLSGHEILDPRTPDIVKSICEQAEVDARLLILELTETVMMTASGQVLEAMRELRRLGVGLSIDDFGTGYSSLSYLDQFPVSEIKIDRSFVKDLERSSTKWTIVESVIKIGAASGINVVAEGIETDSVSAILRELKCPIGQGYLFGPPDTADRFLSRLNRPAISVNTALGGDQQRKKTQIASRG